MSTLLSEEKIAWIRLTRTSSIGPVSFHKLIKRYKSAKNALKYIPELAQRGGAKKPLKVPSRQAVQNEIEQTEAFGAKILLSYEQNFPELLKQIGSPPPLLTVKGNLTLFEKPFLALVGSRNASAPGCRLAHTLAEDLSHKGYMIISGMARGIDHAAHHGALEQATSAVLAGGINHIYPPQNKDLYTRISNQGLLISESHFGYSPKAGDFPRRNRLISGLSLGVVIIEAALRSGSLITANFALEQGREVMAIPGSPLDRRSRGANNLIRSGSAALVETAEDIHNIIQNIHTLYFKAPEEEEYEIEPTDFFEDKDMDTIRSTLLSLLSVTPVHINELIQQTGFETPVVSVALLELELAGFIVWTHGNLVSRLLTDNI